MKLGHRSPVSLQPSNCRPLRAFLLIEALVYIGVSSLLLGIGFAAIYRCIDNSVALRRNADDITTALHMGERWRADVRAASGPVRLEKLADEQILHLLGGSHEITYRFAEHTAFRRVDAGSWVQLLGRFKSSFVESERRSNVTAWKWELELETRAKAGKVRPLLTFFAVAPNSRTQ